MVFLGLVVITYEDVGGDAAARDDTLDVGDALQILLTGVFAVHQLQYLVASALCREVDVVWDDLSASAQAIIDKQGVAYTDIEGDLVTSIVNGKDCVFTCYQDLKDLGDGHTIPNCCLCALERAYREGKSKFKKPISCALYPIRAKDFGNEVYGINYNKWRICKDAIKKGEELNLPVYKFLEGPLIEKFGKEWYDELCEVAEQLLADLED